MNEKREDPESAISSCHVTECSSEADPEAMAKMMRSMHGPQAVDQSLRQAVSMCWMMLPEDKRNVDAVENEMRRLMDRVISDMREDAAAFGISDPGQGAS